MPRAVSRLLVAASLVAALVGFVPVALAASPPVLATATPGERAKPEGPALFLRTPSVSATRIAFAYANDVWTVERAGGAARRLTNFEGLASNPRFSPDGKWVAFSGQNAGNLDVYVVPAEGGDALRVTWHPGDDVVQGWTPDGKRVLFTSLRASDAPQPTARFWTVPAGGGAETPLVLPRAFQGRIAPDGKRAAYRPNESWDEERRNYRGGQNRPIWITDLATHETVAPEWTGSKDVDPAWLGDRVVFVSDRDGVGNVWACDADGTNLAQLTRFTDFDVKALDAGAGVVVFEQGGMIHELDPARGAARVVPITVAGDFPWMQPRWMDVSGWMARIALSPTGKRVLAEARGEIFTIPVEKGDVRNLTRAPGSAERDPAWSPDGKSIAYWSDRSGEYQLMIEAQDGLSPPRAIAVERPNHAYTVSWSPDSKKILWHDTDLRILVLDVATGKTVQVGDDPWMVPFRTIDPRWSPDSKWVAYSAHLPTLHRAIFVADAATGRARQVTDGLADAITPAWDKGGKLLWFLASTNFGLRSQWLEMTSYDREQHFALYAAVLAKGGAHPFPPESDEEPDAPPPPAKKDEKKDAPPPPVVVTIDFDGIERRIVAAPEFPTKRYRALTAGASGTLFVLEPGPGPGLAGGPATLHRYQQATKKMEKFADGVAEFDVSADGKKIAWRKAAPPPPPRSTAPPATPALFVVDAEGKPPADAAAGKLEYALTTLLDPRAEFDQIFAEGWRNQRDYLYVENMHGTDWPAMRTMYGKFLPWIRHRDDLNLLLDRMGGEIAVGHSYVYGGDFPEVPLPKGGLLGADFAIEHGRWRIARILDPGSWSPTIEAPLAGPGKDVRVGDYVVAVDGEELTGDDDLYRRLDGTAGRQVTLSVSARPSLDGARRVVVVPTADEDDLRLRAWVEERRRRVDMLSKGRLAYVYVPDTGRRGYEHFNREYFAQQDREGVIVDERTNGGGSAADYMIEVLERRFDGYFNNVAGERRPFTTPAAGIWGPKVMIVNEMAGSGGDFFPYVFKQRKVGTIVGTRTWGGLVHTADTPRFVDGGAMIAPRGGYFTLDGKWAVENEGVTPDIEVENWPKDVIAGRDPQLEKAVEVALQELAAHPVKRLDREPPPPTTGRRATK